MTETTSEQVAGYDLVLKGGQVVDPANNLNEVRDVGIASGKILRIAPHIPSEEAALCVDVRGMYVTPGILDIHTHIYPFRPTPKSYVESVHPDAHLLASGVTTTVDAGTTGWKHFLDLKENTIDRSKVRILAFINIACSGMVDAESEQRAIDMNPNITASLASAFPDIIVGIKSAHYWTSKAWDAAHAPWTSVERAIKAAELCHRPVMVDFWPRPPERSYTDLLLKKLRPGDIHTHLFAQQFPIITPQGTINPLLLQARDRGILFDLGHGAASFWFRNAVPALRGGFSPDSISTDLHMGNINGPVVSMLHTMSKYLSMGMPLEEVIQRSTSLPAQVIHREDLGTLSTGSEADVAVFRLEEGSFGFADCGKARLDGKRRLECRLTVRAGKIVYDPGGLSMPDWEHAPARYWETPSLQG